MNNAMLQANRSESPAASLVAYAQNQRKKDILRDLVPEKLRYYHEECLIHLHDLEYFDSGSGKV